MAKAPNQKSEFLTVSEAAEELRISQRSLRTLITSGEVFATRLGKRIVRKVAADRPITRTDIKNLGMSPVGTTPQSRKEMARELVSTPIADFQWHTAEQELAGELAKITAGDLDFSEPA